MSSSRASGTTSTAGAQRRPRHGYFRARVLLDAGFAIFAVSAFVAVALDGGAGYAPPAAATASPHQHALSAPVESGQSAVVADAGGTDEGAAAGAPVAVLATPLVAPIPAPTPAAAVVAGSVSLLGLAAMLAGLVTTLVDFRRRRPGPGGRY